MAACLWETAAALWAAQPRGECLKEVSQDHCCRPTADGRRRARVCVGREPNRQHNSDTKEQPADRIPTRFQAQHRAHACAPHRRHSPHHDPGDAAANRNRQPKRANDRHERHHARDPQQPASEARSHPTILSAPASGNVTARFRPFRGLTAAKRFPCEGSQREPQIDRGLGVAVKSTRQAVDSCSERAVSVRQSRHSLAEQAESPDGSSVNTQPGRRATGDMWACLAPQTPGGRTPGQTGIRPQVTAGARPITPERVCATKCAPWHQASPGRSRRAHAKGDSGAEAPTA